MAGTRCGVLLVACLCVSSALSAAEIRRGSGATLEGTVQGLLVVKGIMTMRVWHLLTGTDEWPIIYYALVNGRDIIAIDDTGLRTSRDSPRIVGGGSFFGTVPPDDLDVIDRLVDRWRSAEVWQYEGVRVALRRKSVSVQIRVPLASGPAMFAVYLPDDLTEEQWKRSLPEMTRPLNLRRGDIIRVAEKLLGEFRIEDGARMLRRFIDVETAGGIVTIPVGEVIGFRVREEPTRK